MKKTTKIVLGIVLALALILGVGYAAITVTTGSITGTAKASGDQGEFKVKFLAAPTLEDGSTETAVLTSDSLDGLTATFSVTGLQKKDDVAIVKYIVKNESGSNLDAILKQTADISNTNEEYFTVESSLTTNETIELTNGGSKEVIITITLNKAPITEQTSTITLNLSAEPVEETL